MRNLSVVQLSGLVEGGELSTVETLDLQRKDLREIEDLVPLKGLRSLDVSNNKLKDLQFVQYCYALRTLKALNNVLGPTLTPLAHLNSLTVLNLSDNQLTEVDSALGSLTNLKALILARNSLTSFKALGKLPSLETLVLSQNQIEEIKIPKKQCPLQKLSLSFNLLREFKATEALCNLQELRLNSNKLLKLPTGLMHLARLEILDLGANSFVSEASQTPHEWLCEALVGLTRLRNLNIARNKIFGEDSEGFSRWDELKRKILKSETLPSLVILNSRKVSAEEGGNQLRRKRRSTSTVAACSRTVKAAKRA